MEPYAGSFPDGAILKILYCLEQRDIVRAQLVCQQWHGVAQLARKDAFLRRWGFSALLTEPRSPTLLETIPATSIVRRHVVSPGENVPQLALRFQVGPMELMRLNNLMTPHLLQHRHFVYVPVARREEIRGFCAAFEYSRLLCRDVLVAEPPGSDSMRQGGQVAAEDKEEPGADAEHTAAVPPVTFNRMLLREMQAHVRRLILEGHRGGGGGGVNQQQEQQHAALGVAPVAAAAAAATVSLDLAAARFYLREAEGCTERAARTFVADYSWEQRQAMKKAAAAAAATTVEGDGGESDDESYEYDPECGPEDEDTVLVRRMAAWSGTRERPAGRRLLRLLRLGARLLSCGFCGRPRRRGLHLPQHRLDR